MAIDDCNDLRASSSRLQRLARRDLINDTADDLELALTDLTDEVENEWDEEWRSSALVLTRSKSLG